jgi:NAD(P)-dependent dehydrogenase (short-subunit alcohol dehydrogenase family)
MTEKKVWLITGAGRGLGVDIAKAALAGGHDVVATGRDAARVAAAVGDHHNLVAIKLDVTRPQEAQAAVEAAVAKFGVEGWMESLTPEIAPFGIRTMLVEPGFFRTELLTNDSTTYAQPTIDDYAERTKEIVAAWKSVDGKQAGDPAKLADALVKLVALKEPPARFAAGADAVQTFEVKANTLLAQAHAHRELSTALAYDDA